MAYPISIVNVVYQGGGAPLEPALASARAWLEAATQFLPVATTLYSGQVPTPSLIEGHPMLGPGDVDWSEVPEAQWVFLLWDSMSVGPWAAGATWTLADWRGNGRPFVVSSVPYGVPWDPWAPFGGFPTHFQQVYIHEWKNGLVIYLRGLGFTFLDTYPDGAFIDCGAYPEAERYTRCYRQLLAQLTPEMYAALSAPPPPPGADWGKMMGVATTMLVVGAVGTTMVKVVRERS